MVIKKSSNSLYRLQRTAPQKQVGIDLFVGVGRVGALCPPTICPEPDILLTSAPDGEGRSARVDSVALVVEVADSTLSLRSRTQGLQVYAAADDPRILGRRRQRPSVIHQMWSPESETTTLTRRTIAFGNDIEAATIPGLRIATAAI